MDVYSVPTFMSKAQSLVSTVNILHYGTYTAYAVVSTKYCLNDIVSKYCLNSGAVAIRPQRPECIQYYK